MRFDQFLEAARSITPAVVVGVSGPGGVGVVRNLAAVGVPVLAVDPDPRAPGLASRYPARRLCPDPYYDTGAFVETLREIGANLPRPAVLFPCMDEAVLAASRYAETLSDHFIPTFPDWETMQVVGAKDEQVKAAWRLGVDTPATAFVSDEADLDAAVETVPFPAVFKSSDHLALRRGRFGKAVPVARGKDLRQIYEKISSCGPLMLQEVIPGGDDQLFTLQCYLDHAGRPLAKFIRHKIRQHPRQFGVCRFGTSLWVDDVADAGLKLLQGIGYYGMAGVEFKRDPRNERLKLMEINARHVSWHALATALGVNFSHVAYLDAVGRPQQAPPQVDGGKWIWAARDVPDSLREMVRGQLSPREWLASLPGTRVDAMFSLRDPGPGLCDAGLCGLGHLRRFSPFQADRQGRPRTPAEATASSPDC